MAPALRGLRSKKDTNAQPAVADSSDAATAAAPVKPPPDAAQASTAAALSVADKENASQATGGLKVFTRRKATVAAEPSLGEPSSSSATTTEAPAQSQQSRLDALTDRVLEVLTLRRASVASAVSEEETAPGAHTPAAAPPHPTGDAAAASGVERETRAPSGRAAAGARARRAAQAVAAQLNAKAARLAAAARAAAAALAERRAYFEAVDAESLVEEDEPGEGGDAVQPAAVAGELAAPSPGGSVGALGRALMVAATRVSGSGAAAAAVRLPGDEENGPETALNGADEAARAVGDTPARQQQRTRAWISSLLSPRRSQVTASSVAEEACQHQQPESGMLPAADADVGSPSTGDDSAVSSPIDAATTAVIERPSEIDAGAALPVPRPSLGLSRRASLGFSAPANRLSASRRSSVVPGGAGMTAPPRRSSLLMPAGTAAADATATDASAPNRLSLANIRRISLAAPPAASSATAAAQPSRRSSVLGSGRMSVVPPALGAPFGAIAEDGDGTDEDETATADAIASPPATQAELQERAAAPVPVTFVPPSPAALVEEDDDEDIAMDEELFDDEDEDDSASTSSALSRVTEAVMDACLSPLAALLRACGQSADDVRSMAVALKPWLGGGVRKIGEGTFGEAFKCAAAGVVIKVVPVGGDFLFNGAVPKECDSMRAEANISLLINRLREGLDASRAGGGANAAARLKVKEAGLALNGTECFVKTHAVVVTRGPYAPALLHAWRAYAASKGTENECPALLPPSQLYCCFVLSDGGATDVEHFEFADATEVKALLLHTAMALGAAEEALQFEHRDLHWGNIIVARTPPGSSHTMDHMLRGVRVRADTAGLAVTIIDFTLSRSQDPRGGAPVAFCDLEQDPDIFAGPKKDVQSDTYRRMRKAVHRNWESFCPRTNALWLHYLTDILLTSKHFAATKEERGALRGFRERCAKVHMCAAEAAMDDLFDGMWEAAV